MPVILPKPWSTKPPVGVQVNWGHPLAQGLVGCWNFSEGGGTAVYDSALYGKANFVNGPIWNPGGPENIFVACSAAVPSYLRATNNPGATLVINSSFTIQCKFFIASFNNYDGLFSKISGAAAPFDSFVQVSGRLEVHCGNGSDHLVGIYDTLTAGVWNEFTAVCQPNAAAQLLIYVNGVMVSSTPGTKAIGNGTDDIFMGNRLDNVTVSNASIAFCRVWNRALAGREVATLYANPYAFMQPQSPRPRYWASSASGPGPTLTLQWQGVDIR